MDDQRSGTKDGWDQREGKVLNFCRWGSCFISIDDDWFPGLLSFALETWLRVFGKKSDQKEGGEAAAHSRPLAAWRNEH